MSGAVNSINLYRVHIWIHKCQKTIFKLFVNNVTQAQPNCKGSSASGKRITLL